MKNDSKVSPAGDVADAKPRLAFNVRPRERRQSDGVVISHEDTQQALKEVLLLDVDGYHEPVFSWKHPEACVAVDFDRPSLAPRVQPEDIPRLVKAGLPAPAAGWVTHGGGARLIFLQTEGTSAEALAGVYLYLANLGRLAGFGVEVKCDSRHPAGARGAERCSDVFFFAPSAEVRFPRERTASEFDEADVQRWLGDHLLQLGRNQGRFCPRCSHEGDAKTPPVDVTLERVKCFRCGYRAGFAELLDPVGASVNIEFAARSLVNFGHQRLVMKATRPWIPERVLRPAWTLMLLAANAGRLANDPEDKWRTRVARASQDAPDVVRSITGTWLSAQTLVPRKVTERTAKELPGVSTGTLVDLALSVEHLPGYVPVEALPATYVVSPLRKPAAGLMVRMPSRAGEASPVQLGLCRPERRAVASAVRRLQRRLPGLPVNYLCTLLLAALVAQRAWGHPPVVVVTGPSGSAKTAVAHLACAALGSSLGQVTLEEPSTMMRKMGLHLEKGAAVLFVDELGRFRDVSAKLQAPLALNSQLTFRALYANERTVSVSAALVLAGSTLPFAVVTSKELARRSVAVQLTKRVPDWSVDGDVADLRSDAELREALDTLVADVWWMLHDDPQLDWRAHCFAELGAVDLLQLDDAEIDLQGRNEVLRALYELFRTAQTSDLTMEKAYRGWLPCPPDSEAGALLGELIDFSGEKEKREVEVAELKRVALADVVGFDEPSLELKLSHRAGRFILKFVQAGTLRGQGMLRTGLPPSRNPGAGQEGAGESRPAVTSNSAVATTPTGTVSEMVEL